MSDKNTKMKISELKGKLNRLSKQELVKLVVESYKISVDVQELLGRKLTSDSHVLLSILRNEARKDESSVVQITDWKQWMNLPSLAREKIMGSVWCGNCLKAVIIRDYSITNEHHQLVLKGNCAECGNHVLRVVENE